MSQSCGPGMPPGCSVWESWGVFVRTCREVAWVACPCSTESHTCSGIHPAPEGNHVIGLRALNCPARPEGKIDTHGCQGSLVPTLHSPRKQVLAVLPGSRLETLKKSIVGGCPRLGRQS